MGAKSKGRIPRNKKKSWKKQVDITEVEEFLDDVRLQERHGGLVADKSSADMFIIDSTPDYVRPDLSLHQKRPKRAKVDQDNLRCFENLKGLPGAKVPTKRNFIKDKTPVFVKEKKDAKALQVQAKATVVNEVKSRKAAAKKEKLVDPWASDEDAEVNEWVQAGATNRDRVRADRRVRRPLYMRVKPSLLPAVEVPHAGQSYHPEAQDHGELLQKAVTVEYRKAADEKRWEKKTTAKFPSSRPTEEDYIREMSGSLMPEPEAEAEAGQPASTPAVRKVPKPKTRKQRRKIAERKVAERERTAKKSTRQMENEVFRVRTLRREIRQQAERTSQRQARKLESLQAKATQPLTLGRLRYQAAPIELSLTEELPGSLRQIKPEGCLLEDRYKSLQRRNVIEPRARTTHKIKYKRKRFARITASDREPGKLKTERNF